MSTLSEIRAAIDQLPPHERSLLAAEFPALVEPAVDDPRLRAALERGLGDVRAGRVRPVEEVRAEIASWTTRS